MKKQFNLGYMLGKNYVNFTQPKKPLFKIHWIYDWGLWDEVAVCAFYANEKEYSIKLWEKALQNKNKIPQKDIERIIGNVSHAKNSM